MMELSETYGREFPVTDWPLVQLAGQDQQAGATHSLGELLNRYQLPLKRYLVDRCRCDEHKAQDLLQGFLLEVVLRNQLISQARPFKGHQFRSFLLRALSNYVISQFRKERSKKRQPQNGFESLDDLLEKGEVAVAHAWSSSFDLTWAKSVVTDAMHRMEANCIAGGQDAIWGVFECRLKLPILEGAEITPYDQLVRRFGFPTPIQAQNALTTGKRKFARTLRDIVKEYTGDDTAAEVELRELQLILANSSVNADTDF